MTAVGWRRRDIRNGEKELDNQLLDVGLQYVSPTSRGHPRSARPRSAVEYPNCL